MEVRLYQFNFHHHFDRLVHKSSCLFRVAWVTRAHAPRANVGHHGADVRVARGRERLVDGEGARRARRLPVTYPLQLA